MDAGSLRQTVSGQCPLQWVEIGEPGAASGATRDTEKLYSVLFKSHFVIKVLDSLKIIVVVVRVIEDV